MIWYDKFIKDRNLKVEMSDIPSNVDDKELVADFVVLVYKYGFTNFAEDVLLRVAKSERAQKEELLPHFEGYVPMRSVVCCSLFSCDCGRDRWDVRYIAIDWRCHKLDGYPDRAIMKPYKVVRNVEEVVTYVREAIR